MLGNHEGPYSPYFPNAYVAETMRGSLFPLFPLLVVTMVSQDVANKQETMRESLFPLLALRVMCQNHERVPISPISPICLDPSLDLVKAWTLKIGEIEEIGTLSWFWHITLRANRGNRDSLTVSCLLATSWLTMVSTNKGNRGNRDPLMVLAPHP